MNKQKDNKVLLTILAIATLLVAIVGTSFAYFSSKGTPVTQKITTDSSSVSLLASNNLVSNIKPTTFVYESVSSNTDVIKIDLTANVTSTSDSSGNLRISMVQPNITIGAIDGDDGTIDDIKYCVYSDGTQILAPTSFSGSASTTPIITDTYNSNNTKNYSVYIWVNNRNTKQNNLQDLNFKVSFVADINSND